MSVASVCQIPVEEEEEDEVDEIPELWNWQWWPPQGIRYATGTATGPPNRQIATYNNYSKKEPDSYQDVCDEDSQEDLSQGHIQTYQEQEEAMGLVDNNNKDRFIEEGE